MVSSSTSQRSRDGRLELRQETAQNQQEEFLAEVALGLTRSPKRIPPKFFYDAQGSALFERITDTPEYYPTRTETDLLRRHGDAMVAAAGRPDTLVELGSGSARKTRLLLRRLLRAGRTVEFVPIDISAAAIQELGGKLLAEFPQLRIQALVCDYHTALDLLAQRQAAQKLFLFLGSSLGNYDLLDARALLSLVRRAMGLNDRFLLGLDLIKDPAVLHAAYNDSAGVTAAFNLNLLGRINRELGGHFDLERFRHVALFNPTAARVEMHLESRIDQTVRVDALDRSYAFRRGERLHTENSYKYDPNRIATLLEGTGLRLERQWSDGRGWFSESLLAPV